MGVTLAAAAPGYAVPPSAPDPGAYVANGPVHAIARAGGRTYVGGDFTRVGVRSGPGAVLDPSDGSRETFPEVAGGEVRAAVSDGSAGWYIGGTFTSVGGERHVGLAHVTSEGAVDSGFNAAATDLQGNPAAVDSLAYSNDPEWPDDDTLYAGGEFSKIGLGSGELHGHVAALNGTDGSPVTTWGPATVCSGGPGCSAAVRSLAVAHVPLTAGTETEPVPVVFVGGDFGQAGAIDSPKNVRALAAIWGVGALGADGKSIAGSLVTTDGSSPWAPIMNGGTFVRALKTSSGTGASLAVYAAGLLDPTAAPPSLLQAFQFNIADPATRTAGGAFAFGTWTPGPQGCEGPGCTAVVNALAIVGSNLYFAGDFSKIVQPAGGEADAKRVAKIATVADPTAFGGDQTFATALPGGADGPVRALAASGDGSTLYMGGDFSQRLAALNTSDGSSASWSPGPDAPALAVATDPSAPSVYAGGRFSSVGSVARAGLAAFDAGGLTDWSPGIASDSGSPLVRALAASESTVYVGGRFDGVDDPPGSRHAHSNLAAVDAASGTPVDSFDPAPSGDNPAVLSLSLLDSTLYAGGRFDHIGGEARANVAALDAASGAATAWNPGADDNVYALRPACGAVYAGGAFMHAGSGGQQARAHLAALDPATGAATDWNPQGADGAVLSLASYGPALYAGGNFVHVGGQIRQKMAALDASAGTLLPFNPRPTGPVRAIEPGEAVVYVGGTFTAIGGADRANLAALDPANGAAMDWDPGPDISVLALAVAGDNVYAGGDFASVGPFQQQGIAAFTTGPDGTPASASCLPPPPPPEPPAAAPASKPAPACLAISPLTARQKRTRRGERSLMLRFRLSCPAGVRLRFERRVAGRCSRAAKRAGRRRCARYKRVVDVRRRGRKGVNRIVFKRQTVRHHKLLPGRYRVTLTVLPRARGAWPRDAKFKVVRRHRR